MPSGHHRSSPLSLSSGLRPAAGGGGAPPPTRSWGTAALAETDNAGSAVNPQIAFDASGNALAVWQQFDGTRYNIWANRYE